MTNKEGFKTHKIDLFGLRTTLKDKSFTPLCWVVLEMTQMRYCEATNNAVFFFFHFSASVPVDTSIRSPQRILSPSSFSTPFSFTSLQKTLQRTSLFLVLDPMSILKAMAMFDKNDGVGRPNTVPSSIFYEDCFPDEPTIIEIHETTLFISGRVTLQDLEEAFVHPFTSITMENCILLGVGILLTDVMQLFPSSLLTLTIIGCPQLSNCACYLLTKGLQEAVLQMDRITKDEITFLNRTNAEIHLILNRPWIHEDWECLALLDHLVELKIQNFGTITFPICLGDCPSLRILTFKNGTLANSRGSLKDSNAPSHFRFLPKTLQQLKLHCLVQSDVLNEVLTHGEFLTLLSLKQSTLGN